MVKFFLIQVQGSVEHFADNCADGISWLHSITYHTAFSEGWALYAESPLVSETDIYDNNLMQKYGMLKWQVSGRVLVLITLLDFMDKQFKTDRILHQ